MSELPPVNRKRHPEAQHVFATLGLSVPTGHPPHLQGKTGSAGNRGSVSGPRNQEKQVNGSNSSPGSSLNLPKRFPVLPTFQPTVPPSPPHLAPPWTSRSPLGLCLSSFTTRLSCWLWADRHQERTPYPAKHLTAHNLGA